MLLHSGCLRGLLNVVAMSTSLTASRLLSTIGFALPLVMMSAAPARPQSIIKHPGLHPRYTVEVEPHGTLAFDAPFGVDIPGDWAYGLGARLSVPVAPEGLISRVNDSVAVGLGADFLRYTGGPYGGACERYVPAPAGTSVCVETTAGSSDALIFPVVFQWNFWFTRELSVFGEPGLAFVVDGAQDLDFAPLVMWAGGRYQFSDKVALTGRIGFPSVSLGVSFLL